jgi:hypothetical protein
MVQPTTESPTLAEALQVILNQNMADMFVALPGRVESYNSTEQTASVKPLISHNMQTIDGGEISEEIPVLQNIPVLFQRGGGFFFSFPLKEGDRVLIVFNDRSIDQYMRSADQTTVDPISFEAHGPNGAIAIPGFFQTSDKLSEEDANSSDMMIGKADGGMKIRIKDTVINIENGNAANKSATLAEPLQALWANFKAIFDTHVHPTGVGQSGESPTKVPVFDADIISTKVKLPDN